MNKTRTNKKIRKIRKIKRNKKEENLIRAASLVKMKN
jgi:hypothetical protein